MGAAEVEGTGLRGILAVYTARRLCIAVGDASLLAVLIAISTLTCDMLAAPVPKRGGIQHTLIVATAAIEAGVTSGALKGSAAQGNDTAIGLAADVLLLDIEDR